MWAIWSVEELFAAVVLSSLFGEKNSTLWSARSCSQLDVTIDWIEAANAVLIELTMSRWGQLQTHV